MFTLQPCEKKILYNYLYGDDQFLISYPILFLAGM